ncbi:acetoacetate ligase [Fusarium tjaetaba]|uniref:Acetoacetate ligase n=1 Tax=Fusarium tjaetaba TaxID=1567544 RepID=A0A8H5QGG9_9HYPO|nr:acetoacetate ligase [Fusarium tjaetaba]KAF5613643.1 acetoacetate ligase [Fusarium tjaetaba]
MTTESEPTIQRLSAPPGNPNEPYVVPCFEGELWTIPASNSVMRMLVTGHETNKTFAVVGTGGLEDEPVPFHYHDVAHDIFLCLKGRVRVWAEDQARELGPGDFASVPPGTVHRYHMPYRYHTEVVGLIIPGDWEEYFRFISERYAGSLFPTNDRRDRAKILFPKLMAASDQFDMTIVPEKQAFEPQPWDGSENKLPGAMAKGGYFLRDGEGDRWELCGTVVRPMATLKETGDKFTVYDISSSIHFNKTSFKWAVQFKDTHHAVYALMGKWALIVGNKTSELAAGETGFVPAGCAFRLEPSAAYARAYVFANGGGYGQVLTSLGTLYDDILVPQLDQVKKWTQDIAGIQSLEKETDPSNLISTKTLNRASIRIMSPQLVIETDFSSSEELWRPSSMEATSMWRFMQNVNQKRHKAMKTYQDLYNWSVGPDSTQFWADLWDEARLIHEGTYTQVVDETERMDKIPRWFQGIKLNFAENILYSADPKDASRSITLGKEDDKIALIAAREPTVSEKTSQPIISGSIEVTWGHLRRRVALTAGALRARGCRRGDRVAAVASNSIDTLVLLLATTAIGSIFSSMSTDLGAPAILDRLGQIQPRLIFVDDIAIYNGKTMDLSQLSIQLLDGLTAQTEFEGVIIQSVSGDTSPLSQEMQAMNQRSTAKWSPFEVLRDFLSRGSNSETNSAPFERLDFCEPFLIVYSSGTTGKPKCITHSTGGVLLNAIKEGHLHQNYGPDTICLNFSSVGLKKKTLSSRIKIQVTNGVPKTSWIVYILTVVVLLHGSRIVLYDGSPLFPDCQSFIRLLERQRVTDFGTSPRWLASCQKQNVSPRAIADLSSLRTVTSTGMVLTDDQFKWFYNDAFPPHVQLCNVSVPPHVQLCNVSGGTDMAGALAMNNPLTPVFLGGFQCRPLGMAVNAYELSQGSNSEDLEAPEKRVPIVEGEPGELVVTKPFPNMPPFFWGDADGREYFRAYFNVFDSVWRHGDVIKINKATGRVFILSRSDGILNPDGIRFGPSDIYSVVESKFTSQIQDSVCVGARLSRESQSEIVILFVVTKPGHKLTHYLDAQLRKEILKAYSKRHVPGTIVEVPEIPITRNGKKAEVIVKQIVSGQTITSASGLANPESLEAFKKFAAQMTSGAQRKESKL